MREQVQRLQPQILAQFDQVLAKGRLSHAYLFSGNFGGLSLAFYLAQSRFCEALSDGRPCGVCRPCRLIASGDFADVTLVQPSGQVIKTEQIRNLTQAFAQSGFEARHQVFIIQNAEKMHPNAANSLLKQIEEPGSPYSIFLLTADESQVLATIRSRCQVVRLLPDRAAMTRVLEEQGLLKSQAKVLSQLIGREGDLEQVAQDKKLLELLSASQAFLNQLKKGWEQAYLASGRLVTLAADKAEQVQVLDILTILAAQDLPDQTALVRLVALQEAKKLWQANVSFQNALDNLVLTLKKGGTRHE